MDDLIAASAVTAITSRDEIALMGRFITAAAIAPDAGNPGDRVPVETALRRFAAGAGQNGLPGVTWDNSISLLAVYTNKDPRLPLRVGTYWEGTTGKKAATAPAAPPSAGWGPGEGYFQFDQAGVHHGSLLDSGPKGTQGPMQKQMLHWLASGVVVDPL